MSRAALAILATAAVTAAAVALGSGVAAMRLLHIGAGVLLVGGIVGRDLALRRAATAAEIGVVAELVGLAGRFEALFVRPGSFAILAAGIATMIAQGRPVLAAGSWWLPVSIGLFLTSIPLIVLVFLPAGRRFETALAGAEAIGRPTAALATAFADRSVAIGRVYELAVIGVIGFLMVVKPF